MCASRGLNPFCSSCSQAFHVSIHAHPWVIFQCEHHQPCMPAVSTTAPSFLRFTYRFTPPPVFTRLANRERRADVEVERRRDNLARQRYSVGWQVEEEGGKKQHNQTKKRCRRSFCRQETQPFRAASGTLAVFLSFPLTLSIAERGKKMLLH